jgi:hypothetical protein
MIEGGILRVPPFSFGVSCLGFSVGCPAAAGVYRDAASGFVRSNVEAVVTLDPLTP